LKRPDKEWQDAATIFFGCKGLEVDMSRTGDRPENLWIAGVVEQVARLGNRGVVITLA